MDGVRSDDFAGLLAALGRNSSTQSQPPQPSTTGLMSGQFNAQPPSVMQLPNPQSASLSTLYPTPPFWQGGYQDYNQQLQQQHFQQQLMQQQLQQQQVPQTPLMQQAPSQTTFSSSSDVKKSLNPWIVVGLLVIVILCMVIAWARMTRVVSVEDEDEEEVLTQNETFSRDSRKEPREVPPPSSVTFADHQDEDEDASEYVSENLLKYVNEATTATKKKKFEEIDLSGVDIPFEVDFQSASRDVNSSKRIVADDSPEVLDYGKRRDALFGKSDDE